MPPLDPGAEVDTIMRSGRPIASSPAFVTRACEPSCAVSSQTCAAGKAVAKRENALALDLFPGPAAARTSATIGSVGIGCRWQLLDQFRLRLRLRFRNSSFRNERLFDRLGGGGGVRSSRTSLATRSGSSLTLGPLDDRQRNRTD